jgi:hypothetical protein
MGILLTGPTDSTLSRHVPEAAPHLGRSLMYLLSLLSSVMPYFLLKSLSTKPDP